MVARPDIAFALADVAREINTPRTLEETLDAIVHAARGALPGIDHVGVTVAHNDGRMETKAATDQLVLDLDALQYEFGEGPCLHAIEAERVVVVENARQEQRWPQFIPAAVRKGLRAQMGICLFADEKTLGALNLYSLESDTIDPSTEYVAELFATHAALAFGRSTREEELNTAIATRAEIGKAVGLIMARYEMNDARAFEYLVRVSSHTNVKLRDIALEVVAQHNEQQRGSGSAAPPSTP